MKLLHLYHDIMNLYGEYANVLAMREILSQADPDCEIVRKTIGDEVDFAAYDFVYIGSGTERGQKHVLADFRRHRDAFAAYVDGGEVALLTGNAFEMLGKSLMDCEDRVYDGLGLFDFVTTEQNKTRDTGDAVMEAPFLSRPAVGFINKCSRIAGVKEPLFTVKMGLPNSDGDPFEGARLKNLFCTHLTGPVLMKNPELLVYMAKLITHRDLTPDPLAVKGYEVTLKELTKRMDSGQ